MLSHGQVPFSLGRPGHGDALVLLVISTLSRSSGTIPAGIPAGLVPVYGEKDSRSHFPARAQVRWHTVQKHTIRIHHHHHQ
uniref:Putative secreted protein n=1 Tax=Anopheles darlingi TaxID=43151 RepID=A0A2M4DHE7_ANODA